MILNVNKMLFAAFLVAAFVFGAFLSYLWVVGYYVSLELKIPEKPVISLYNFTVSAQDPTFFNITILNPSFSPRETDILGIKVLTGDNIIHRVTSITPTIPVGGYRLHVGSSETFKCLWKWVNYTGQSINIIVLVEDGSGGTLTAKLPLVEVEITSLTLDPEHGDRFNLTIRNSQRSTIGVDLESIKVIAGGISSSVKTYPSLPIRLEPSNSTGLLCEWNWTDHQGEIIKVIVNTSQGYISEWIQNVPNLFSIREIGFNPDDPTYLNITVANSENSPITLNITTITITLKNGTILAPTNITPNLPYVININSTATFSCKWNWSAYSGEEVTITVSTEQNYRAKSTYRIPQLTMEESAERSYE
ncbi:MAG: hypothetical protein QXK89_01275 [Candidatus Bathyarchaeia archaeon]|nr:hypothetical protein [Candidatus Bathyarchaeota archaeon]